MFFFRRKGNRGSSSRLFRFLLLGVSAWLIVTANGVAQSVAYPSGADEDVDVEKCKPPKKQKPPEIASPQAPPVCHDVYDTAKKIDLKLVIQGPLEIKPGESTIICAFVSDCDFKLQICTQDNKTWLNDSQGLIFTALANPADFTFTWTSSKPGLTVTPPPVCVTYTAPSSGSPGGGKKTEEIVTIRCTVDDAGNAALADDPPVSDQIDIRIRYPK